MNSWISAVRFGFGVHYDQGDTFTLGPSQLLKSLDGPDQMLLDFPIYTRDALGTLLKEVSEVRKKVRSGDTGLVPLRDLQQKKMRNMFIQAQMQNVARAAFSEDGFKERLVQFWFDHFTVSARNLRLGLVVGPYIDEAIRPNISGKFEDLLIGTILHPAMLIYLDQFASVGPLSQKGLQLKQGLNENLARELLELHTMGVNGSYTQKDVRQLAELLTGLRVNYSGQLFDKRRAEPGVELILGTEYGSDDPSIEDIKDFLRNVAVHPDTARNIAQKLVVHFVDDNPSQEQVDQMAAVFLKTGGDLRATYKAMLDHPESWRPAGAKVKRPFEYMVSGMRALGFKQTDWNALGQRDYNRFVRVPMQLMGQVLFRADGPDGQPEDANAWVTPARLAARLQWTLQTAAEFTDRVDPRDFATRVLGPFASEQLIWSAERAENSRESLALVLASPEFNRR